MDLEGQGNEVELSEEVEVVTDAIEEPIAEDFDADAEVTGEDALAILAGEDQAEEEAVEEEPAEEPKEEPVEDAVEDPVEAEAKEEAEDAEIMESITNERTRERFQSLSHKNKELIESSKQQTQVIDNFRHVVEKTGLSSEEFMQGAEFVGGFNSPDWETVEKSIDFFMDVIGNVKERHGKVDDAYQRFDDLKKDYEDGEANEDYVNDRAQKRIKDQAIEQQQQREAQQRQDQERAVQEQGGAIQNMVNQFRANDPDFALKESQLEALAIKVVQDGTPMGQWATEFVNRYHAINVSQRKPSPTPMSSSRQAQNVNNFASSNVSDEQANIDFAMSLIR